MGSPHTHNTTRPRFLPYALAYSVLFLQTKFFNVALQQIMIDDSAGIGNTALTKQPQEYSLMSKTTSPFNLGFDLSKFTGDIKWPSTLDFQPVSGLFQKYVETLTAANQTLSDGLQTYAKRQAEIARSAMEDMSSLVSQLSAAGTPEEKIVRQIELCKQSYESAIANAKELAELATKSNSEAANLWADHISGSFEDIKVVTKKATGRKAA